MIPSSGCPPWPPDQPGQAGDRDHTPLLHHAPGHDPHIPPDGASSRRPLRIALARREPVARLGSPIGFDVVGLHFSFPSWRPERRTIPGNAGRQPGVALTVPSVSMVQSRRVRDMPSLYSKLYELRLECQACLYNNPRKLNGPFVAERRLLPPARTGTAGAARRSPPQKRSDASAWGGSRSEDRPTARISRPALSIGKAIACRSGLNFRSAGFNFRLPESLGGNRTKAQSRAV